MSPDKGIHAAFLLSRDNVVQTMNSQKTPHTSPLRVSLALWRTAPFQGSGARLRRAMRRLFSVRWQKSPLDIESALLINDLHHTCPPRIHGGTLERQNTHLKPQSFLWNTKAIKLHNLLKCVTQCINTTEGWHENHHFIFLKRESSLCIPVNFSF